MSDIPVKRNREDEHFLKQDLRKLEEMRRQAAREAETRRLMEAFGIADPDLVGELANEGFDTETFRLLYLVPLLQVAWSDGAVSRRESDQLLEIARLHGVEPGSPGHQRLLEWLAERPSEQFFHACLRGIQAMLRGRPAGEAQSLSRDLVWYSRQVAAASGGFLGLGSRISSEEEQVLTQLAKELDTRHHDAVEKVTGELSH